MRSWVFSAWLTAPVRTKRTRLLGEDRRLRPGGQADGQAPGGDVVDGAAPGVGGGDAVADQPLVQRQIRELALLDARAGVHARPGLRDGAWPSDRMRVSGWAAGARAAAAVRGLAVVPGCDRGWAWVIGSAGARRRCRGIAAGAGG